MARPSCVMRPAHGLDLGDRLVGARLAGGSGAAFGIHCLDLGTVIAGKTSLSVKMVAAGRMCDCGLTFGSRCIGTAVAGKTSDNV